ncbi:MAG: hypothetical protein QOE96_859 [Blastocatellia bacterium]|jgi:hypothetical protein|nr:hypothetical protein [Blastocatellia bacterium]
MYFFCTYFDSHYLTRGLALYESLEKHCSSFELWILCMDSEAHNVLAKMSLPHARLIKLEDFERGDEALLAAKNDRSRIEYYFTCTPSLPLYVFDHAPEADLVTYVDADHYFFSDPLPIFEEMADNSILLIEHRFPSHLKHWEDRGIFNVGVLSFRRDQRGIACLKWWRERCIEWCYDRLEDGRFADQRYLDEWPQLFAGVKILQNKGAGLAPWNASNYEIVLSRKKVTISGDRLICYHFHGFNQVGRRTYATGLKEFDLECNPVIRRHIYRPYLRAILRASRLLAATSKSGEYAAANIRYGRPAPDKTGPVSWRRHVRMGLSRVVRLPQTSKTYLLKLLEGEHLIALGKHAI